VPGATSASLDTGGLAAGDYVRITTDGGETATTAAVAVAAAPVGNINPTVIYQNRRVADPPNIDIDVSAYAAGDTILVAAQQNDLAVTVNSNAATLEYTVNIGSERRITVSSYVLQASDISTGIVEVLLPRPGGGTYDCRLAIWHIEGTRTFGGFVNSQPHIESSITVTPNSAQNAAMCFAYGLDTWISDANFEFTSGFDDANQSYFQQGAGVTFVNDAQNVSTSGFVSNYTNGPGGGGGFALITAWWVE